MQEKTDELYEEYLKEKLDSIFKVQELPKNNKELYNGYKLIEKNGLYNLEDKTGKIISNIWFSHISDFVDGYAIVEKDYQQNFIDINGNLVSNTWYSKVWNYSCGLARVCENGGSNSNEAYNYIDHKGKLLCDEWFTKARDFHEKRAVVRHFYHIGRYKHGHEYYTYIDNHGKFISGHFYKAEDFSKGLAVVQLFEMKGVLCNCVNCIDRSGKLLVKREFWNVKDITEECIIFVSVFGRNIGRNDYTYCFYSKDGEQLINQEYDYAGKFHNGYSCVRIKDKWNYIDENGKYLSENWFDDARDFGDKYAPVKCNGKYHLVDKNGELVDDVEYDEIDNYVNGFAIVKKNNKYGFIDIFGNLISNVWYDKVEDFQNNCGIVKKNNLYAVINESGNIVSKWVRKKPETKNRVLDFIINEKGNSLCCNINYGKYKVINMLAGFQCKNGKDSFYTRYEPIRIYGKNIVLCVNKNDIYIFDRDSKSNKKIGTIKNVKFDNNFIHVIGDDNEIVYFAYNDKVYDITKYYNERLKDNKILSIKKDISIISKNDFFFHNEEDIKKLLIEDKRKDNEAHEKNRIENEKAKLLDLKRQNEINEKKKQIELSEALRNLNKSLATLERLEKENRMHERIRVNNILIDAGDHKEINPLYLNSTLLRHIDLSMISFENVKIAGIDFRGCNINLKPQEVYGKNLSGCNFEGLFIPPFMDFTGVDIRGTKFSRDGDPKTLDGYNNFTNSIYDETTTFDGIPFTVLFNEYSKNKIDLKF